MVEQEAEGGGGLVGEQHRQEHGPEQHHRVEADVLHVQPVRLPGHGAGAEQHQQGGKAQHAVSVVPVRERNDPQQHDEPGLGNGGLVAHLKGQPGEEAVVKRGLQGQIQLVEQPGGQVDQGRQQPAEEAPLPGPGHHALPAQDMEKAALVDLAVAPGPHAHQAAVDAAVIVDGAQRCPEMIQIAFAESGHEAEPRFFRCGF